MGSLSNKTQNKSLNYPIRVLCVMSTLDRGGAESMCMNLYRRIDKELVQFDFVKHSENIGAFEDEISTLGGKVYCAPRYKLYNHVSYVNWWNKFLINHPEYRIVHGHFFTISAIYFSVAKKLGRVTIGHIHSTEIKKEQVTRPLIHLVSNVLISQISKYTDYRICCSVEAGKWVYKDKKFKVLNNAVDVEKFRYSSTTRERMRKLFSINDELVLGTVANYSPVKNPMGLIDIYIAVKSRKPTTKLIWVGSGEQYNMIHNRIKQEGIEGSVLLLGVRNDVPDILQAFDVFLLPSFSEGLPVSLIEAQASGLPCYISDRITKEVDLTGECRFLPIDKPEVWAEEITNNQIVRKDNRSVIREAGYDIDTTANWLQGLYMGVVD